MKIYYFKYASSPLILTYLSFFPRPSYIESVFYLYFHPMMIHWPPISHTWPHNYTVPPSIPSNHLIIGSVSPFLASLIVSILLTACLDSFHYVPESSCNSFSLIFFNNLCHLISYLSRKFFTYCVCTYSWYNTHRRKSVSWSKRKIRLSLFIHPVRILSGNDVRARMSAVILQFWREIERTAKVVKYIRW